MQTIPSLWKGLLMFWMTGKALREGEWEGERKANQCTQNGIWMAFSAHYSSNYIPPSDLLPGYFSLLFLHQNGAINWQVKLDWIKGRMKEVKRVVSSRLNVIGVETKKNSVWEKVKKKSATVILYQSVIHLFLQIHHLLCSGRSCYLHRPSKASPSFDGTATISSTIRFDSLRSFVHTVSTYSEHLYECLNAQNVQKHSAQCKHSHRSLYVVNRRANEDLCY